MRWYFPNFRPPSGGACFRCLRHRGFAIKPHIFKIWKNLRKSWSDLIQYHLINPWPHAPGINLDEVQRNLVRARGQVLVRLLDVVRLGLGVVTTTDLAKRATLRDLDTVEAFEVFGILEVGGQRLERRWGCVFFQHDVVDTEAFVVRCRVQLSCEAQRELTLHSGCCACHFDLFLVPAAVFTAA